VRVLVCGGRDYSDYDYVRHVLYDFCDTHGLADNEYKMPNNLTVIHGGARGADSLADQWAVVNWVPVEEFKADWKNQGKAAGILRNIRMLDEGKPDYVIAFPGGRGTAHMVSIAKKAGVSVIEA
jgi:hypothetical protein